MIVHVKKENIAILWPFIGFDCLTKHIICINHEVTFIIYHYYLGLIVSCPEIGCQLIKIN